MTDAWYATSPTNGKTLTQLTISVIVPTFQREKELRYVLSQLFLQVRPADEIIVIDQTRRHELATQEFLDRQVREQKIKLFRLDVPNLPAGRNRGLKEATSDIVLCIDDDVIFGADFVLRHLENYANPCIVGVTGGLLCPEFPHLVHVIEPAVFTRRRGWMEFPLNYSKRCETIFMVGCNFSVRRSLALKVGGFDENFFGMVKCDDNDFSWRIHQIKGTVIFDPRTKVFNISPKGGCNWFINSTYPAAFYIMQNVFYFNFQNFSLADKVYAVTRLFKRYVATKNNLKSPRLLCQYLFLFVKALAKAVYLVLKGRKLLV